MCLLPSNIFFRLIIFNHFNHNRFGISGWKNTLNSTNHPYFLEWHANATLWNPPYLVVEHSWFTKLNRFSIDIIQQPVVFWPYILHEEELIKLTLSPCFVSIISLQFGRNTTWEKTDAQNMYILSEHYSTLLDSNNGSSNSSLKQVKVNDRFCTLNQKLF